MKKIKILRIIARLNIGGPAIHTILLTEGLDKERFDSLLVYGSVAKYEGDMYYYSSGRNIKMYHIPELKRQINLIYDLVAFIKILNVINNEKPQIIHTHTAKAGTLGRLAGLVYNLLYPERRVKLLHTFHGHIFEGYFNKFKTKIFIFIERFLASFSTKIITVSEAVKQELVTLSICKENKIELIPLGLELDKFFSVPDKNNNIFNVGIVGRLVPIKNQRLFLEAAAKTIKDNPDFKLKFKIIGDGQLRQDLESYAQRLNINSSVVFLGWQKDLASIYSDLDIIALTSLNEGTPVSLIEAMAANKIVVATDVGGVKELLGDEIKRTSSPLYSFKVKERGILVEKNNSDSFAAALTFILRNSNLRKEISMPAREYVRGNFNKQRLIKDTEFLYKRILNANSLLFE